MSNWRSNRQARGRGRGYAKVLAPPSAASRMENIASVSRSSGLEKDGDALKDFKMQEDYRKFIQDKLDLIRQGAARHLLTDADAKHRVGAQENVLILFKKLREGILSSQRQDEFAVEVYETSLYLSTLFGSLRQTASMISHLLPGLYKSTSLSAPRSVLPALLSLLHHLVASYPSQGTYSQHFDSLSLSMFPRKSEAYIWINSIAQSIRRRNYVQFEALTLPSVLTRLLDDSLPAATSLPVSNQQIACDAFYAIIDSLRSKVRETTWAVLRSTYRELACAEPSETRQWLSKTLGLCSRIPEGKDITVDEWLEKRGSEGHVRPKDGVEGRWIVCKIR